jgi:SAM-dependent methyltransferase
MTPDAKNWLTSIDTPPREDQALATHRSMWAQGDYATVADEVMAPLGPILVRASGIDVGDRVLDVAAGSGNVSIPAAMTGATVVASDLTPELLHQGQERAAKQGVTLDWREANAEALPFGDSEFDAVLSAIGVMFAPRHQRAADELVRVCRPGGTIGLVAWTPEGWFGRMLAMLTPSLPDLETTVGTASMWGREDYVRDLLGDRVVKFTAQRHMLRVDRFDSAEACRDYFKSNYGPAVDAYRNIADDPMLVAALDTEFIEHSRRYLVDGVMEWQYLLVTARKR